MISPGGPRARAAGLLRALLAVAFSLLVGEGALRLFHRVRPIPMLFDDSYNRFRGKPFAEDYDFRLNSRGFKDLEFPADKGSAYRILGIGDSFAFGVVPYRYNYLTRLEELLRDGGAEVEVLNMGIPGIGPRDYLALLVHEGLALEPDMVVLSFFVGNDLLESRPRPRKRRWYSRSYVATLAAFVLAVRKDFEGTTVHGRIEYDDEAPSLAAKAFRRIESVRGDICLAGGRALPAMLDGALGYLREFARICRSRKIALVVVLIPDEVQVDGGLEGRVRAWLGATAEGAWSAALPNERLAAGLADLGVDFLDLLPPFARAGSARRLYKPRDTHWNIAGNELAAELIRDHVAPQIRR